MPELGQHTADKVACAKQSSGTTKEGLQLIPPEDGEDLHISKKLRELQFACGKNKMAIAVKVKYELLCKLYFTFRKNRIIHHINSNGPLRQYFENLM